MALVNVYFTFLDATDNSNPSGLASIFSPRMDFEQWKPLTGRGDPLRNDPTYDYEPPVLERVHYWADDTHLERDSYPERKSEVLMLGVSSRKPSVSPRQPPSPPRRHHRPSPSKYEDYTYKLSEHYPMTILVPPPPPPPGHKPSLYILDEKHPSPITQIKLNPPKHVRDTTTVAPEHLSSLYALQEANLIYQSSTTSQNWITDYNQTQSVPNNAVSSDYAGWGPTTPFEDDVTNAKHNLISTDHLDLPNQPYSFYKPMLSEAPPPPRVTQNPLLLPTFVPTALPPVSSTPLPSTVSVTQPTWPTEPTTEDSTFNLDYNEETTTANQYKNRFQSSHGRPNPDKTILDMLSPMMTMPLVNGPDRPEDHLYAHASENLHVYKEHQTEDSMNLETMQTMQPPPVSKTESTMTPHNVHMNPNTFVHKKPSLHTHDPYLHMRFTSPMPTIASSVDSHENIKSTTEAGTVPMYLIIQGHSKVKNYGSKPKLADDSHTIDNEIPKPNETNEVKHLHPIREKYVQKPEKLNARRSRAQNLKSLVDEGHGSIEIQETDVGIKYDVSDGSEVPIEIYRAGIVDNDENNYSSKNSLKEKRTKRQLEFGELLPDEDTIEEYLYNFLKGRRNETGITGVIAQAVTGDSPAIDIDDEEDDDDDDDDDEDDNEDR